MHSIEWYQAHHGVKPDRSYIQPVLRSSRGWPTMEKTHQQNPIPKGIEVHHDH